MRMGFWLRCKKAIRNAKFSHKMFAAFFLTSSITIIPLGFYSYHQAKANLLYPVSYTHLDVYKRQVLDENKCEAEHG